tara:strand:+ start:369 stop:1094 length:726 start_codon:yes stop_codon:yes gene_type:complete
MTIQQMLLATSGGDGSVKFDFTGISSLPSGLYDRKANVSGLSQTVSFVTAGLSIAGDAPNDGNSYPIAINTSFTGDYLFQMSTRIDIDPNGNDWCSDAGIGLFNTNINSSWVWRWATLSGRIAAQNNCPKPFIYSPSYAVQMTNPNNGSVLQNPYISSGDFVTMHLRHLPSQSKTTYKITVGSKDWTESGTVLGTANDGNQSSTGILEISEHFGGSDYYVGIGADDDDDATIINGFRYIQL